MRKFSIENSRNTNPSGQQFVLDGEREKVNLTPDYSLLEPWQQESGAYWAEHNRLSLQEEQGDSLTKRAAEQWCGTDPMSTRRNLSKLSRITTS